MDHPPATTTAPTAASSSEVLQPPLSVAAGTISNPYVVDEVVATVSVDAERGGEQDSSNKRTALAGQWRTPPLPVFPTTTKPSFDPSILSSDTPTTTGTANDRTTGGTTTATVADPATVGALPLQEFQLPDSTEDYAKALQEAYRRGAEAAALAAAQAAQHQQPRLPLPLSVSCPNFLPQQKPPPTFAATSTPSPPHDTATATAPPSAIEPKETFSVVSSAPPSSTPGTIVVASIPACTTFDSEDLSHADYHPFMPPPPPPSTSAMRGSLSLPNMVDATGNTTGITGYSRVVEEEKRLKRLARNRASARMRRMRKKTLIDAYETEVGVLEKTLQALKHHEWGATLSAEGNSVTVLTEALSMDRGQQALSKQERQEAAADILRQQLEYVEFLEELMQEQYVLYEVGMLLQEQQQQEENTSMDDSSLSLLQDLAQELQLAPEQLAQLQKSHAGWEEEWGALQTIKQSLQAMASSNWLWNDGCTAIAEEFLSILHKNQVSKFLLWADANLEAIDELDGVNAPHLVPHGPSFLFGVNNNPEGLLDLLDEEKA